VWEGGQSLSEGTRYIDWEAKHRARSCNFTCSNILNFVSPIDVAPYPQVTRAGIMSHDQRSMLARRADTCDSLAQLRASANQCTRESFTFSLAFELRCNLPMIYIVLSVYHEGVMVDPQMHVVNLRQSSKVHKIFA
jgi:hypothetical protein